MIWEYGITSNGHTSNEYYLERHFTINPFKYPFDLNLVQLIIPFNLNLVQLIIIREGAKSIRREGVPFCVALATNDSPPPIF